MGGNVIEVWGLSEFTYNKPAVILNVSKSTRQYQVQLYPGYYSTLYCYRYDFYSTLYGAATSEAASAQPSLPRAQYVLVPLRLQQVE